ncbi:MAG: DUF6596 domain-containing protein [Myxococcota bacterium]
MSAIPSRAHAHGPAVRAAREATGRMVARLSRYSGDIALAEDAFATALLAAIEQWPTRGVPDDPEGWLYTVARRSLVGQWRRADVRRRKARALAALHELAGEAARGEDPEWPDERLPLLFVCAHPAIAPSVRAPLMLQTVLGMTAEQIGPLMGLAPKSLGQRLWRAKAKIREARVPFAIPDPSQLASRSQAVLDAVYGLYAAGWADPRAEGLAEEAVWLAEVVAGLLDNLPEAHGLCALLLYVEARRSEGRRAGRYVPLDEQDPAAWNPDTIAKADQHLGFAHGLGVIGPFQLEAAIQSALVHGHREGKVDHAAVLTLYDGLVDRAPTLGLFVGRAAAIAEHHGAAAGLEALDALQGFEHFQPYWAVRASLLSRLGDPRTDETYARAEALTGDPAVLAWLQRQRSRASVN